jgi:hypothetical protein
MPKSTKNQFGCQGSLGVKKKYFRFPQNTNATMVLIDSLLAPLETLSKSIAIYFGGAKHPPIEIIKTCNPLSICRIVAENWLVWLKTNHIPYNDTTINEDTIICSIIISTDVIVADIGH